MGVPVVGTHNALDSIEMMHKKQGFISDSDDEMASYLVTILSDILLREKMSNECRKFVLEKYSILRGKHGSGRAVGLRDSFMIA